MVSEFLLLTILLETSAMVSFAVGAESDFLQTENSHLEVRAVMVKCDLPEEGFLSDETTRFQREELFKHNFLQDCKQKLAMTIKMSSDPEQDSGEEYIPIEHVLGVKKKRIRLLNPYVVRLRRKAPFEAYKIRRVDTVRGVIVKTFDKKSIKIGGNESRRIQRDIQLGNLEDDDMSAIFGSIKLDHGQRGRHSFSIKLQDPKPIRKSTLKTSIASHFNFLDHDYLYTKSNKTDSLIRRSKRHIMNDYEYITPSELTSEKLRHIYYNDDYKQPLHKINVEERSDTMFYEDREPEFNAVDKNKDVDITKDLHDKVTDKIKLNKEISGSVSPKIYREKEHEINNELLKKYLDDNKIRENDEINLVIYEIGEPDIWYSAQVQLYEKLISPEGKTLWNDLTKEETAKVNSAKPEWSNQGVIVQYKPTEFIAREEFMLPSKNLRLVVPLKRDNVHKDNLSEFVIVHVDDIIILDEPKEIKKRNENCSEYNTPIYGANAKHHRQVLVRATRALMGDSVNNLKIVTRGTDRYLKLSHPKPHFTQMDLEARADDNELILIGVSGRLTTIVSDTTRRIRSILTVQATNTGLAAARMRVLIRECSPDLLDGNNESTDTAAGPTVLPPKYTKTFRFTVPLQIPIENANCTIVLVNDDDDSVAVRDVRIKRDDRCYCVWHCDCVCLGEDPKLICQDMSATQLSAAGLSTRQKTRRVRSVCYPDVVVLNLFVTFIGVIITLLNLGIIKAFLGLMCRCVGSWGLPLLLQTPRKLDHYYECALSNRPVVYDNEGWPIHPDTKQRNVRLVSRSMEFILNVIFFITLPCVIIWDSMKRLTSSCHEADDEYFEPNPKTNNECYSSNEIQVTERRLRQKRRSGLRKWMTPQAEELTTGLWHESLTPAGKLTRDCLEPLLRDEAWTRKTCEQSSFIDSEQDDTEYVLMQMQKSRESLAKSQRQETKTHAMNYSRRK